MLQGPGRCEAAIRRVSLHLYTAAVALATVAGFVSFVPGGAVVREAVLDRS